jgi:DNA repair protein RecO (recombination protein O)
MAIRKVRGIILHRREITESSLILSVFSDRAGKLNLLARGALRRKSAFKGRVELFSLCHLTYYESLRRGLNILSESDVIQALAGLRENLTFFSTACYLIELVDMGTGLEERSEEIFYLLSDTLGRVASFPDIRVLKRYFELHLLGYLGYRLQIESCAMCRARRESLRRFSASAGGMICEKCSGRLRDALAVSPSTRAALRYLLDNSPPSAASLRFNERQAKEMEAILRSAILYYLERWPRSALVGI